MSGANSCPPASGKITTLHMPKILIVDDEEAIRTTFALVLRQKGYDVIEADAGLTGYELAKQHLPDLIITDISMQGGGGEALLHFIRHDPQLANKQVVMITGATHMDPRKGMEAGADDFLVKPINLEALLGCVEARLRRAKIAVNHAFNEVSRRQDEIEKFLMSAKAVVQTPSFRAWERSEYAILAIVFTDIVDFTKLCEEMKDEAMKEVRRAHFARSRFLIDRYQGCEIKTMGDSVMAAFASAQEALRYALELQKDTGHPLVNVRAAIHIGPMHVEENDVFGGTVNFAGRIIRSIQGAEIWMSDEAKKQVGPLSAKYDGIEWDQHDDIHFKGFPGTWTLWSVRMPV
jgi:DNA-binding response OmpR family regulator